MEMLRYNRLQVIEVAYGVQIDKWGDSWKIEKSEASGWC